MIDEWRFREVVSESRLEKPAKKRAMLTAVVAEVLLIPLPAVGAPDHGFAWVVMFRLSRVDGRSFGGRCMREGKAVRSPFHQKKDKECRRQKPA
jgi:hypothetical protein